MSSLTSGFIKVDDEMVNSYGCDVDVLFIKEQQLVTFGNVFVSMIPEYCAATLMEMVMSGNEAYLDQFFDDLGSKRFDSIVAWLQTNNIKESGRFFEENDA